MRCPSCLHPETKVIETRETEEKSTRRRRACIQCDHRFTTYERFEKLPIIIVKNDGNVEMYDRDKTLKGILIACNKRPVTLAQINKVIDEIETEIRSQRSSEIPSTFIGERIMDKLKLLDEVAYIRFASVYKKFTDAETFSKVVSEFKPEV